MATTHKDLFYSKVMLFGEYSIIMGSMGLTIPFSHFNGQLAFVNDNSYTDLAFAKSSNKHLTDFCAYIDQQQGNGLRVIDTEALGRDLAKGIIFESSIPESYGLGSSGALVAAVYSKYAVARIMPNVLMAQEQLASLKQSFAFLESYFHGKSSGIDPLICYLNHPLCIEKGNVIRPVDLPMRQSDANMSIFLVNSGAPGKTAPLVQQFLQRMANANFADDFNNVYVPLVNGCISSLIQGEIERFTTDLKTLSAWQLTNFEAMIPKSVQPVWRHGIESGLYNMKLCGSGGGGYVLGFTNDYENTELYFNSLSKELVPVYQV